MTQGESFAGSQTLPLTPERQLNPKGCGEQDVDSPARFLQVARCDSARSASSSVSDPCEPAPRTLRRDTDSSPFLRKSPRHITSLFEGENERYIYREKNFACTGTRHRAKLTA